MIISRTPLRISLGGGGTDLPSYYRGSRDGGFLIAGAISRHVYIAVNDNFDDDILLKYSQIERVGAIDEVRHPLLREALRLTGVDARVEISAMSDIPANTGLGSSGSFTVGLLNALHAFKKHFVSPLELAREAAEIEIERLAEPAGKQDQYIASIGGVTAFEFRADDSVEVVPVVMSDATRDRLDENLLLFYTGLRRSSASVLHDQASASGVGENLDAVRRIGLESFKALESGDLAWFSDLMTEQWNLKLSRSSGEENQRINDWIAKGLAAGATGGKLVGAGGGGFLLFYSENKADLRQTMLELGLPEVRFSLDHEGSKLIVT